VSFHGLPHGVVFLTIFLIHFDESEGKHHKLFMSCLQKIYSWSTRSVLRFSVIDESVKFYASHYLKVFLLAIFVKKDSCAATPPMFKATFVSCEDIKQMKISFMNMTTFLKIFYSLESDDSLCILSLRSHHTHFFF